MILIEENDDRFYIEKSNLPNAGSGVFAKEKIKAGEYLEIIGVYVKAGSEADKCTEWAKHYKFAAKDKDFDRYIVPMGYAAIINHTSDSNIQNAEIRYLKNIQKKNDATGGMVYYFIKDIEKNEEILGNYGEAVGKKLDWIQDKANFDKEDWQTFLRYDLYNLGILSDEIKI